MGTFLILAFGLVFYILGLPWWSLFPCAFFIGLGEARQNEEGRGRRAFAMGLVGGGIVWVGSSALPWLLDKSILLDRMAQLFGLPSNGTYLFPVLFLLGGVPTGLFVLGGFKLGRWVLKFTQKPVARSSSKNLSGAQKASVSGS